MTDQKQKTLFKHSLNTANHNGMSEAKYRALQEMIARTLTDMTLTEMTPIDMTLTYMTLTDMTPTDMKLTDMILT